MFQHVKITKQTLKNPGIIEEAFWNCKENGGASSPRAIVTGGTWVHAPPQNPESGGDS